MRQVRDEARWRCAILSDRRARAQSRPTLARTRRRRTRRTGGGPSLPAVAVSSSGCHCTRDHPPGGDRVGSTRLDDAVRASRGDAQIRARRVDRLVVRRVRGDRRRADDAREARAGSTSTRCTRSARRSDASWSIVARVLRRNVLHQRAAQRDVHDLRAAADRERRHAALGGGRARARARRRRARRAARRSPDAALRRNARGSMSSPPVSTSPATSSSARDGERRRRSAAGSSGHQAGRGERVGVRLVDANARAAANDFGGGGDDDERGERHE